MKLSDSNLFIVDVETTGTSPHYGRVIEIGILRVEKDKVVQTYRSLVNPLQAVPPFIEQLTGITSEELENAPEFGDIVPDIKELSKDAVFVAHNAAFDYGFLRSEFKLAGTVFSLPKLCTVRLSRLLYPRHRRHDLSSIITRHDLACEARHRAFDDAKVLWDFIEIARKEHGEGVVDEAAARLMKLGSKPLQLPTKLLDSLHEGPGVYIFKDREGKPLYVGKSIHVKERVLSHFQDVYESGRKRQMLDLTADIECVPCVGELEALLLESETIKSLQPTYNVMSRERRMLLWLRQVTDKKGYLSAELRESRMSEVDIGSLLGVFKTRQSAEEALRQISSDHMLCDKIMGLERIKKNCFGYELGKCGGACLDKEGPGSYNLRFELAFKTRKVRKWPHRGPVLIKEVSEEGSAGVGFLVDNWCLVKKFRFDGDAVEEEELGRGFDLETYKILSKALNKKFQHLSVTAYREETLAIFS